MDLPKPKARERKQFWISPDTFKDIAAMVAVVGSSRTMRYRLIRDYGLTMERIAYAAKRVEEELRKL